MKALVLGRGASGKAAEAALRLRGYEVDFADGYNVVIASPGIKVRSELQLGVEMLRERGIKLLAITGSKGKSSVVKLVADGLTRAGHSAIACGNYGLPVSDVKSCEWAVVEVSSFQLETTYLEHDAFKAAAILNLQDDHLDRHLTREIYHNIKKRLLSMAEVAIDESSLDEIKGGEELLSKSYFDNPILRKNGMMAVALMRVAGLSDEEIKDAFLNFEPLPHRMQYVDTIRGIRCINDSKATSLAALEAGVVMTGSSSVRLIAGGLPKGDDPKSVQECLTKRVKKVYLIGVCAEKFLSAWSSNVNCEICETLDRAVESALRDAVSGETILLSPGAASYDQFKTFEERGKVFMSLIKKEGKKE